jgi:hypothetical protein
VFNATVINISAISWRPSAITNTVWVRTRLAAASDKVYQLLAHGRWFSPASSTTKPGRHDIAEILMTVALNTKNQIKSTNNKDYI